MLAGGLNAIAGGGSFISFPALIFAGVSPINANATSTVALLPGSIASVGAYRNQVNWRDPEFLSLVVISIIGGILGAIVLLNTPQNLFVKLLPYLLLSATLLFTFSKSLTQWLKSQTSKLPDSESTNSLSKYGMPVFQGVIALYGGFFGGGIGILMLALLSLMGMENINKMNGIKTVLAALINGMAIVPFVIAGIINWHAAILMAIGAGLGGYLSAYYAQKLNPTYIRRFVIFVGFSMTIYFFIKS
ncbi:putative permease [Synechococcus sp. PCC 7502]|nr:putative permease [Synechococcus sp. PCC 7502]